MKRKYLKPTAILCLIALLAIGGTLAYLTDETSEVTNTFTAGSNVGIDLYEYNGDVSQVTSGSFTVVPGGTATKDPTVEVDADTADCYLFIYVEATEGIEEYVTYSIDDSKWIAIDGYSGYYVYSTNGIEPAVASAADKVSILTDNVVTYSEDIVDVSSMSTMTLEFTAYALQEDNIDSDDAIDEAIDAFTFTPDGQS